MLVRQPRRFMEAWPQSQRQEHHGKTHETRDARRTVDIASTGAAFCEILVGPASSPDLLMRGAHAMLGRAMHRMFRRNGRARARLVCRHDRHSFSNRRASALPPRMRPGDALSSHPRHVMRARGMPGAGRPHGPPAEKNAGGRYHRFSRDIPAFPARWCYGLYVISPVNGLSCHRRLRNAKALSQA